MGDEDNYSPKRSKRSRSESGGEDIVQVQARASVIQHRKQHQEELEMSEEKQSSDYYCRKGPSISENSINNILKVVSLQSFSSSPRSASSSEGSNGHQTTSSYVCRANGSYSPSTRSNGESSPSSEDSASSSHTAAEFPPRNSSRKSSSRGRRGEKANNILKDEKYWEKRVRNNASAKRSRDARRVRELECQIRSEYMEEENRKLENENKLLREENMRLLNVIEDMKSRK